eukprot:6480016-Amphidinium_carterae.1
MGCDFLRGEVCCSHCDNSPNFWRNNKTQLCSDNIFVSTRDISVAPCQVSFSGVDTTSAKATEERINTKSKGFVIPAVNNTCHVVSMGRT